MGRFSSGPAGAQQILSELDTTVIHVSSCPENQAINLEYVVSEISTGLRLSIIEHSTQTVVDTRLPRDGVDHPEAGALLSLQKVLTFSGCPQVSERNSSIALPPGDYQLSTAWIECQ